MRDAFGVRFGIFGAGWDKEKLCVAGRKGPCDCPPIEAVPVTKSHEVYQKSWIGLSVSLDNQLENYTSDRLFRILGCGALLLAKRFPGADVLGLRHEENCLLFETADEAVALAKEWIASPERVQEVAAAGAKLARENHTWLIRLIEMQALIEIIRSR